MRIQIALVPCALVGCAYKPGAFSYSQDRFPGQRATVGCLDISVERRADLPIGPVLGYHFANRCDHAAVVDLGSVAVVGRTAEGAELALRPYDPRAELRAVALDGRNAGAESLVYPVAAGGASPSVTGPAGSRSISLAIPPSMAQVCADVATLVHQAPSQCRVPAQCQAPSRWLCFAAPSADRRPSDAVGSVP